MGWRRSGSGALCGVVSCVVGVMVCVVVVAMVVYLMFRPNLLHATAAQAELSTFSLALKAWTLTYNLSLAVDLTRHNARLALRYHSLTADAYYQDQRFAHTRLPDFAQPAITNTTRLTPSFHGRQQLFAGVAAAAFRREDTQGTYSIHVFIDAKTHINLAWPITLPGPNINLHCPLRLHLSNATADHFFHPTACHISY
uniref:Late embryogenesis abundant protein LEA-2 subgroup domain-containing protein n=1 Tax=Oryza punctata TaxID=4537 RepID=A0A0E0LQB1_ORYPU